MTLDQAREHGVQWADVMWSEHGKLSTANERRAIRQCYTTTLCHECVAPSNDTFAAFEAGYVSQMRVNRGDV